MDHAHWITEATDTTFQTEVVERSRQVLVIVDFWAPWCGPCRALTPALEAAIAAREGKAWLVKVNVDENPGLAETFRVQGVPTVMAFHGGQIVDQFVGARDRRAVEAFIDGALPSAEETSLRAGEAALAEGRVEGLDGVLAEALEAARTRDRALLILGKGQLAAGRFDDAAATLEKVAPGSPEAEAAAALLLRISMVKAAGGADEATLRAKVEENPKDPAALWALAGRLVGEGKLDEGLQVLLDLLAVDRKFEDDGARRAMLAIFDELGVDHEISRKYRRQMMIYL